MPLYFFAYVVVEVLAFVGMARLVGLGWAFLLVFALSALGALGASAALRGALRHSATRGGPRRRGSLAEVAGDSAVLFAGWILCVLPGFVSTALGVLMILPPTRAVLRSVLTAKARAAVENFGVRVYSASPMSRRRDSYGSFADPSETSDTHDVIDADELERWFREEGGTDGFRPRRGEGK